MNMVKLWSLLSNPCVSLLFHQTNQLSQLKNNNIAFKILMHTYDANIALFCGQTAYFGQQTVGFNGMAFLPALTSTHSAQIVKRETKRRREVDKKSGYRVSLANIATTRSQGSCNVACSPRDENDNRIIKQNPVSASGYFIVRSNVRGLEMHVCCRGWVIDQSMAENYVSNAVLGLTFNMFTHFPDKNYKVL